MSNWLPVVITAAATLGAVWLTEHFQRRSLHQQRRDAAYARFSSATHVFLLRAELMRRDSGWRESLGDSVLTAAPLIMAGVFWMMPKRILPKKTGPLELAKLISTPGPHFRFEQSRAASLDALGKVVDARAELELIASQAILTKADAFIDACETLANGVNRTSWLINAASNAKQLEAEWSAVKRTRVEYVAAVADKHDRSRRFGHLLRWR